MPQVKELRVSQIVPHVRYVQTFQVSENAYPMFFRAYDHRVFYVWKGSGTARFQDRSHALSPGDFILWHAGVDYQLKSSDTEPLILLGANFDFTRDHAHLSYPIVPAECRSFEPDQVLEWVRIADNPQFNEVVYLPGLFGVEELFLEMTREYDAQKIFCAERLGALLTSILCMAYRNLSLRTSGGGNTISAKKIDEIIQYIQHNYEKELDNAEIGQRFNYHPNYLNKQIKVYTGKSLHQYLISYRIARAIDWISTTDLPIAEIAFRVGFRDVCHFTKIFRQKTGVSPSEMRFQPVAALYTRPEATREP